jgi:hypothetical protein
MWLSMHLWNIGENHLKGLLNPEHLWQVIVPDLPQDFSALQSLDNIPNHFVLVSSH